MKTRNFIRQSHGWMCNLLQALVAASLPLVLGTAVAIAEEPAKSADEIAKELSNPAGGTGEPQFQFSVPDLQRRSARCG